MKEQYTYLEAAKLLGVPLNSLKLAVSMGNIKSFKVYGKREKYITHEELMRVKGTRLLSRTHQTDNNISQHSSPASPAPSIELPLPRGNYDSLIQLINEGFKAISNDQVQIAERYKEAVKPIVNSAVKTDEQTFFNLLAGVSQKMLNNALSMYQQTRDTVPTLEDMVYGLTEGITEVPLEFREALIQYGRHMISHQPNQLVEGVTPA